MKVKCKICGHKGRTDIINHVSEFWASAFLMVMISPYKNFKSCYICRNCSNSVLESLQSESYKIKRLHEPEVNG